MNPFTSIPDNAHRIIYLAWGLAGLVLGMVATYCTATGAGIPSWVIGASAALGVLSSALGFTAASNVSPQVTIAASSGEAVTVTTEPTIIPGTTLPETIYSSDLKADATYYDAKHDRP